MDLRSFEVPADIAEILAHQIGSDKVSWYQPFVFTNDVIAGAAAVWNANGDKYLCTRSDPEATRKDFLREALILGDWYSHLTDVMLAAFPDSRTFLDFGCNLGHFGIDLVQRGKAYVGIDAPRNEPGVRLLQNITGIDFEFVGSRYDEERHRLDNFDEERTFDVGILSVVLMHLTDPHYAMPYFASKFRRGFFFSSAAIPGAGLAFRVRITRYNRDYRLPHTFELIPTVPLAEILMRHCGFPHIYRIPYRDGPDPKHSQRVACWIAAREAIPHEAATRFKLSEVADRSDDFTEPLPAGWSSDTLRNQ